MKQLIARVTTPSMLLPLLLLALFVLGLRRFSGAELLAHGHWIGAGLQVLVAAVLLAQIQRGTTLRVLEKVAFALFVAFASVAALSLVVAGDFLSEALRRYVLIIGLNSALLVGIFAVTEPRKIIDRIAYVLAGIGILVAGYSSLVTFLTEDGRGRRAVVAGIELTQCSYGLPTSLRMCSLTGNPNTFSMLVMLATVALLYLFLRKHIHWLLTLAIFGLFVYGQSLTLSRTGMFASVIGVGVLVVLFWIERKPKWVHVFAGLGALAAAVFTALQLPGGSRLLRSTLSGREGLWEALFAAIREKPWLGSGFGVSVETVISDAGLSESSHNIYLALAAEIGVPGLLIFIALCVTCMILVIQKLRASQTEMLFVGALIVTLLVHQVAELQVMRNSAVNTLFFVALGFAMIPLPATPATPRETLLSSDQ